MCGWRWYGFLPLCCKTVYIVSCESVLNRLSNFMWVCHNWFDLPDEFCLFSKYTKAMTLMWIHSIAPFVDNKYCQQMDVKQDGMHIVIFLNRVIILRVLSYTVPGFQTFNGSPIPKYWLSSPHPGISTHYIHHTLNK